MKNKQKFELIIGIELHLQISSSKQKMFSYSTNDPFHSKANTNVTPVCLGLPGALPVPNYESLILAQKMAYALNCKLGEKIIFERKNYFYPDLPKGYQITCPHYPIGYDGLVEIDSFDGNVKQIKILEVHLEEDTAKSVVKNNIRKIDFNKSGVPLLEIVSAPDFRDIEDVVTFCKEVQLISRYLDISDADMEKGHLRLEANVSVRKLGQKKLPNYRVELKNINSFGYMRKAVIYEYERQMEALLNDKVLVQETRGFDQLKGQTFVQRKKEDAHDYRYFPDPDIPPIFIDKKWLLKVSESVGVLPSETRKSLRDDGLNSDYIMNLTSNRNLFEKYLALKNLGVKAKKAADLVSNYPEYKDVSASEIFDKEKEISGDLISDETQLLNHVNAVLDGNAKAILDYTNGNENAVQFLVGKVMQLTKGKASPQIVKKLLIKQILIDKTYGK